jgi:hypothetical protein
MKQVSLIDMIAGPAFFCHTDIARPPTTSPLVMKPIIAMSIANPTGPFSGKSTCFPPNVSKVILPVFYLFVNLSLAKYAVFS